MKKIWDKEIVVKRTIGGYIKSNIIITLVISLITFLELVWGIKFLLKLNLNEFIAMQNDVTSISGLAVSIAGNIMLYLVPLIFIYMAVITILMIAYELNKNSLLNKVKAETIKTAAKPKVKTKKATPAKKATATTKKAAPKAKKTSTK